MSAALQDAALACLLVCCYWACAQARLTLPIPLQGRVANDVETEQIVSAGLDRRHVAPSLSSVVQVCRCPAKACHAGMLLVLL